MIGPPQRHPPTLLSPPAARWNSHGQNESGPERPEIPGQGNKRDHSSESANPRMKIPGNPNIEK